LGAVSDMLLKFDLASIPAGAAVSNATLRLHWLNNNSSRATIVYVLGALKPWTEGTGAVGSGATLHSYDGVHAWDGGAINAAASNYDTDATASRWRLASESWANTYVEFDVTALVASWLSGVRTNLGFVVVNNGKVPGVGNQQPSEYNVATREDGAHPPELRVLYLPPATLPPQILLTGLTIGGGANSVVWTNTGGPAATCAIYRSTNLLEANPPGGWSFMQAVLSGGSWADTNRLPPRGAAFYQIRAPGP